MWGIEAMKTAKNQAKLIRPQRQNALRIIRVYRTVSDEAALFLAGTLSPLHQHRGPGGAEHTDEDTAQGPRKRNEGT